MARSTDPNDEVLYDAADRWIAVALRGSDSLFTPGAPIWTVESLDELDRRFVQNPDESSDPFVVKLERQLAHASPEAIQLMAEVVFVHFLAASAGAVKGETKRALVNRILGWSPRPVSVPTELSPAFDRGVAHTGTAFNTFRPFLLHLLITFARRWKTDDREEQDRRLADPWAFRDFLFSIALPRGAQAQREALLHLVHPDTFERIVSPKLKTTIAKAFSQYVSDPSENVDRQLLEIRAPLEETYGAGFHYWEPRLLNVWQRESSRWAQFIEWARLLRGVEGFDAAERDYKIETGRRLAEARTALLDGRPWFDLVKASFTNTNLTAWQMNDHFLKWCAAEPEAAGSALRAAWEPQTYSPRASRRSSRPGPRRGHRRQGHTGGARLVPHGCPRHRSVPDLPAGRLRQGVRSHRLQPPRGQERRGGGVRARLGVSR